MLYSNVYFWLGEIGLSLGIISCAVLMYRFRTEKYGVILPFWFALLMQLVMLTRPAIYTLHHAIPMEPYLYRFAMGLLIASRAFVWRSMSLLRDRQVMDKMVRYLVIAGTLFLLFLGYRLKNK